MKYIKLSIFTLTILISFLANAQQQKKDSVQKLSIQQSIAYALTHQINVVTAQYEVKKAAAKVKEVTGIGLPQISGTGNFQDFLQLPTTVIPLGAFDPYALPGAVEHVKFGTQYNTTGELDASQILFQGSYIVGLEASKTYKQLSQKSLTQASIQTVSQVTKAYYTVLVNRWKVQMFDADAARLKALMNETEAMYKSGFAEKLDWERVKVNYNNVKTQEDDINRLVVLSYKLLKFQMGMPMQDSLTLSDSLKSLAISQPLENDSAFKPENRIEYSLAQTQLRASELILQNDHFSNLPSLSLYGSFIESAYNEKIEILTPWYPSSIIGLKLNVPIFSGLQRTYRAQEDKIGVQESLVQLKTVRESISLDVSNSVTALKNALADLKNQEENMNLAQNVEHDTKIKYEAGTGSNLEVVDAETALTEAETAYYNALFNTLVAKVDYEQSKGTLYK